MSSLERLLAAKEIAICCGSGGVGKTTTAAAAAAMASATSSSKTPKAPFARAAASFTVPRPRMSERWRRIPETGKFSTARCVWAPQRAPTGTRTSPIESRSIRKPPCVSGLEATADGP